MVDWKVDLNGFGKTTLSIHFFSAIFFQKNYFIFKIFNLPFWSGNIFSNIVTPTVFFSIRVWNNQWSLIWTLSTRNFSLIHIFFGEMFKFSVVGILLSMSSNSILLNMKLDGSPMKNINLFELHKNWKVFCFINIFCYVQQLNIDNWS